MQHVTAAHRILNDDNIFKNQGDIAYKVLHMCNFIQKHSNHQSPLEHMNITVRISDMSRAASHQWVRHRLCAHSQQSQRYTTMASEDTYFAPGDILNNDEAYKVYTKTIDSIEKAALELQRLGIKNEDIRYLYPNAFTTQIVTTMNLRNWLHLFEERCCTHAQEEIRYIAYKIKHLLNQKIPFLISGAGPKCLKLKYCPEHKSCGYIDRRLKLESDVTKD